MNSSNRKVLALTLAGWLAMGAMAPAWAVFDEPQKGAKQADTPAATPEAQAALDAGLAAVRDVEGQNGAGQSGDNKAADSKAGGGKLSAAAKAAYTTARAKFAEATKADPNLAQAWNGLGYTNRKLGDYKTALTAYDKALELRMGYPEATEYRGEAYLALNRPEDAKQAYLDLFSTNRELAGRLLESMKKWATTAKNKDDAADMKDFIDERSKIASQTAALTRDAVMTGWN